MRLITRVYGIRVARAHVDKCRDSIAMHNIIQQYCKWGVACEAHVDGIQLAESSRTSLFSSNSSLSSSMSAKGSDSSASSAVSSVAVSVRIVSLYIENVGVVWGQGSSSQINKRHSRLVAAFE